MSILRQVQLASAVALSLVIAAAVATSAYAAGQTGVRYEQNGNVIRVIDARGNLVREIHIPFSQESLWKEAANRRVRRDYWGTHRQQVLLSGAEDSVLCRIVFSQPLASWFEDFKRETTDEIWKSSEPSHQSLVSSLLAAAPNSYIAFGRCGTLGDSSDVTVVAVDSEKPEDYFWLDATSSSKARLCRRIGTNLQPGVRVTCNFIGTAVKANDDESTLLQSSYAATVDQVVSIKVNQDPFPDLCVVAALKDPGPFPQPLASGDLVEVGGKRIDSSKLGIIACATTLPNGSLSEQTLLLPPTWIGDKRTRGWTDIDGDQRSDFCRIVSRIDGSTQGALLLCTQVKEPMYGASFAELLELD